MARLRQHWVIVSRFAFPIPPSLYLFPSACISPPFESGNKWLLDIVKPHAHCFHRNGDEKPRTAPRQSAEKRRERPAKDKKGSRQPPPWGEKERRGRREAAAAASMENQTEIVRNWENHRARGIKVRRVSSIRTRTPAVCLLCAHVYICGLLNKVTWDGCAPRCPSLERNVQRIRSQTRNDVCFRDILTHFLWNQNC